jgi:ABC-type transport system substrate-binding protein
MMRRFVTAIVILSFLVQVCQSSIPIAIGDESGGLTLKAAVQTELESKNILNDNNLKRSDILWLCYDTVLKLDPETEEPLPYILRGTEINGIIGLQTSEIGNFDFMPGSDDNITAYYDFTNLFFHDGEQVDVMDIIFSYHLFALHPTWYLPIIPLMDGGNISGNFSFSRWLWVSQVDDGDSNRLTAALRFHLTIPYYAVWEETLNIHIFPQHLWEGRGKRRSSSGSWIAPLHSDFGYAIDPEGKGVSISHPSINEFRLTSLAIYWEPSENDIIGTGMFEFDEIIPNFSSKLKTYQDYLVADIGKVQVHVPHIDGIEFIKFNTPQQATMGIKKGEVDIILWSVPPDFIKDLQSDPNVIISFIHGPELIFVGFNMRSSIFGYPNGDPLQADVGKPLREAISNLIDKRILTDVLHQGYGLEAAGPVSQLNTFWYNASLPLYDFNVQIAKSILDANGYSDSDDNGWRDLDPYTPGEQDQQVELLAPTADYDPIHAHPCILVETHLREAGINAKCNHQSFIDVYDSMENGDFEAVYSSGVFDGHSQEPTRSLHDLFYCSEPGNPRNIFGYCNSDFDNAITLAMKELDENTRQSLVKDAQGIVVEDLPMIAINFKDLITAYNGDRFINWRNYRDSLFNYWSLMNIRPPSEKRLRIEIIVASAVSFNKTEPITVRVRDQDRRLVKDALVQVNVKLGNLTYGGIGSGSEWEGITDANGQSSVDYEPPYNLNKNGTKVYITAFAGKNSYDDSNIETAIIVIFPEGVSFLSVTMEFSNGNVMYEGETTELEVIVRDESQSHVENASVQLASVPSDMGINPSEGYTSIAGRLSNISLTAPDVDVDMSYFIIATPSKTGRRGVEGTLEISVLWQEPPPEPQLPVLEIVLTVVFLFIIILICVNLVRIQSSVPQ